MVRAAPGYQNTAGGGEEIVQKMFIQALRTDLRELFSFKKFEKKLKANATLKASASVLTIHIQSFYSNFSQ